MEARRIRLQGERGISRQTIAQGMPECSGCTCMLVCALCLCTLHTRPRVQQAPGIPCSLCFEGKEFQQSSGAVCVARTRNCIHRHCERSEAIHGAAKKKNGLLRCARNDDANCHRPRRRTIQYPRDVSNEIDRPQRTGYPAFAGYDDFVWCRNDVDRSGSRTTATPAAPPRSHPRR
jgi:hypothetical protein